MDTAHRRRAPRTRAPRPEQEVKRLTAESLSDHLGVMLKAEAVAELLDVPVKKVYNLARDNDLPHVRVGGRLRFPSHRLAEWIDANSNRPRRRE